MDCTFQRSESVLRPKLDKPGLQTRKPKIDAEETELEFTSERCKSVVKLESEKLNSQNRKAKIDDEDAILPAPENLIGFSVKGCPIYSGTGTNKCL